MKLTVIIILLFSLINGHFVTIQDVGDTECYALNELTSLYENGFKTNREINRLVPILEKATGWEAQCNKGTYGYEYLNHDSLLLKDICIWSDSLESDCDNLNSGLCKVNN